MAEKAKTLSEIYEELLDQFPDWQFAPDAGSDTSLAQESPYRFEDSIVTGSISDLSLLQPGGEDAKLEPDSH